MSAPGRLRLLAAALLATAACDRARASGGRGRASAPRRIQVATGDLAPRVLLTGALRATALAAGNDAVVVAAACVANAREPATCAAACQGVLAAFDARKVLP